MALKLGLGGAQHFGGATKAAIDDRRSSAVSLRRRVVSVASFCTAATQPARTTCGGACFSSSQQFGAQSAWRSIGLSWARLGHSGVRGNGNISMRGFSMTQRRWPDLAATVGSAQRQRWARLSGDGVLQCRARWAHMAVVAEHGDFGGVDGPQRLWWHALTASAAARTTL